MKKTKTWISISMVLLGLVYHAFILFYISFTDVWDHAIELERPVLPALIENKEYVLYLVMGITFLFPTIYSFRRFISVSRNDGFVMSKNDQALVMLPPLLSFPLIVILICISNSLHFFLEKHFNIVFIPSGSVLALARLLFYVPLVNYIFSLYFFKRLQNEKRQTQGTD